MYEDTSSSGGEPKGSFEIFKAEGDVLFKQQEYKKALKSYVKVCLQFLCSYGYATCHGHGYPSRLGLGQTVRPSLPRSTSNVRSRSIVSQ